MHRLFNQGVGHAAIARSVVVLTSALGQGLQRRPHGSTADLVENSVDKDHSVLAAGQGEAARLNAPGFFVGATLRVGRMARVVAGIVKAGDGELSCLPQETGLIEALADSG